MTGDNPFEETSTVIRPNPGGRRGGSGATPPPVPNLPPDGNVLPADDMSVLGFGPMVTAAGLLLSLAGWIRHAPAQSDITVLRQRLLAELQSFDAAARRAGQGELAVRQADYILSATLDDVIANTIWGSDLDWSRQSLARTRHNDATGGDQVFKLIEDYRKDPANNLYCLELAYFCLSLGFEGRMRILDTGDADHLKLRENLLRIIRQVKGASSTILSPQWRGYAGGPRSAASAIPLWVVGVVAAAILTAAYVGFSQFLSGGSGRVAAALAALPPQRPSAIVPVKLVQTAQSARISRFLEKEIEAGLVIVLDDGRDTTVRIVGSGMFASGSDRVNDGFLPLLDDIARALVDTKGRILITGHTDNQPIRFNAKFPSNLELSRARARAVQTLIIASAPGVAPRVEAEGRAYLEPVDSNDSPEGRQRNRRIDLVVPHQSEDGT